MTRGFMHEWKTAWREAAQGIHSVNGLKAGFVAKKVRFCSNNVCNQRKCSQKDFR